MNEPLYFDVETTPVRHDERLPQPIVAAYAVADGPIRLAEPAEMARLVREHQGPVVGHNVAFDLAVLGLGPIADLQDTAVLSTLHGAATGDPAAANSSLARLAKKHGIELTGKGTIQLSFKPGVPLTPEQVEYVKEDVRATRSVYAALPHGLPDEQRQVEYSRTIFQMAREGIRVDLPRIRAHTDGLQPRLEACRLGLVDAGLIQPRGPKSNPWKRSAVDHSLVQQRLERAGVSRRTPTGELAADESVLLGTRDPVLAQLVEYNSLRKELSMWEAFDTGEGDIVRARWKSLVLTGRISCSGPNLTNIPQRGGLRECLVPREGRVLVVADYPALEMRTWAYACLRWLGHSTLIKLWGEGRDPHIHTASSILGIGYDAARVHPNLKEIRHMAKGINFGLPGGMGVDRLREHLKGYGFEIGPLKAWELRRAWFKAYPEAKLYFDYIKAHAEADKFRIALPDTGRSRLGFYSEACNFPFQGLGSDCSKGAVDLCQRVGVPVLALVHDELIAEAEAADAREVGETVIQAMKSAGEERCPGVPWEGIEYHIYPERWVSK